PAAARRPQGHGPVPAGADDLGRRAAGHPAGADAGPDPLEPDLLDQLADAGQRLRPAAEPLGALPEAAHHDQAGPTVAAAPLAPALTEPSRPSRGPGGARLSSELVSDARGQVAYNPSPVRQCYWQPGGVT